MSNLAVNVEYPKIISKFSKERFFSQKPPTDSHVSVAMLDAVIAAESYTSGKFTNSKNKAEDYLEHQEFESPIFSHAEAITNSIVYDLVRIEDGWSGLESKGPSDEIIRDVGIVLNNIISISDEEVDVQVDEDGSVTIYLKISGDKTLSFDISGNNKVQCTYVTSNFADTKSEIFKISDFELIVNFIDSVLHP